MNGETSGNYIKRAYYHDYQGRVIQTVEKNHLGGTSRVSLEYDFTRLNNTGNWAVVTYDYDELGRLSGKTYGSGVNAVTKTLPSLC